MSLVFRSTTSETYKIIGEDSDGSRRVATAVRAPGEQRRWDLKLEHPSGRNWSGTFSGPNVLDALGELLVSKEPEYIQSRGRGHRPQPMLRDDNVSIRDDGTGPPTMSRWR